MTRRTNSTRQARRPDLSCACYLHEDGVPAYRSIASPVVALLPELRKINTRTHLFAGDKLGKPISQNTMIYGRMTPARPNKDGTCSPGQQRGEGADNSALPRPASTNASDLRWCGLGNDHGRGRPICSSGPAKMDIEHVFQTRSILQVSTLKSEALSAGEIILTTRYAMVLKDKSCSENVTGLCGR